MDWNTATPLLQAKLDPKNVQPPRQFGPKGSYIEGWHAMAEANRIFGFGEWSYTISKCQCVSERPRETGKNKNPGFGVTYVATVRVVIGDIAGDVIREDVGAGHGYDIDCGLAHESAVKEAVTDALKRALRSFGNPFGLALYDKSRENVGVDQPPFDAAAAMHRIIDSINKQSSDLDLTDLWKRERDTVDQIGGDGKDRIINAFKARKAVVIQQKDAA